MSDILFRTATVEDAQSILDIYSYYVKKTAITFEYEVPSVEEFANRIRSTLEKYPYIVALQDEKIIGYGYAGVFKGRAAYDWACEMTIYLSGTIQKKGVGKRLYLYLEEILKKMGICNLYACITYPEIEDEYVSKNSAQFHEHLGYRFVGTFKQCGYKFNRWYDMVWMEKMIGEHKKNQENITWFSQLSHQN